jgi:hypothetical protein
MLVGLTLGVVAAVVRYLMEVRGGGGDYSRLREELEEAKLHLPRLKGRRSASESAEVAARYAGND